jgi:hypothetical protein
VIAVINESNSSRFSFNFLTSDSIARFANPSDSPPCCIAHNVDDDDDNHKRKMTSREENV